ncbi:hypothetical protein AB2H46_07020 [Escherichia coli]
MTHKTKATGGGRQWENTKHKPEHHSDLLAGGQILSGPAITGTTALSRLGCAQLFSPLYRKRAVINRLYRFRKDPFSRSMILRERRRQLIKPHRVSNL